MFLVWLFSLLFLVCMMHTTTALFTGIVIDLIVQDDRPLNWIAVYVFVIGIVFFISAIICFILGV